MEKTDKNRCRHHGQLAAFNNLFKIKLTDTLGLPPDPSRADESLGSDSLPVSPSCPALCTRAVALGKAAGRGAPSAVTAGRGRR